MSEPRLPDLTRSFERHLRAENKPDRTIETYLKAVRLLEAFLSGRCVGLADADRTHFETRARSQPTPMARMIGKGRRERALHFGRRTAVALDRYLRVRSRHAHAAPP